MGKFFVIFSSNLFIIAIVAVFIVVMISTPSYRVSVDIVNLTNEEVTIFVSNSNECEVKQIELAKLERKVVALLKGDGEISNLDSLKFNIVAKNGVNEVLETVIFNLENKPKVIEIKKSQNISLGEKQKKQKSLLYNETANEKD